MHAAKQSLTYKNIEKMPFDGLSKLLARTFLNEWTQCAYFIDKQKGTSRDSATKSNNRKKRKTKVSTTMVFTLVWLGLPSLLLLQLSTGKLCPLISP
jgi:hypothetical protein